MKYLVILSLVVLTILIMVAEVEMDCQKCNEMLYPTVKVETKKGGNGAGVVVYSGGGTFLVLTAKHVLGKSHKAMVITYPDEQPHEAVVLRRSEDFDLAMLVVVGSHPHIARVSSNPNLRVYDDVWKVGSGMGLDPHPSQGIISALEDFTFHITTEIVFGDSGGPIFKQVDGHYELVGIVQAVAMLNPETPVYHIGIAQNWESLAEFLLDF